MSRIQSDNKKISSSSFNNNSNHPAVKRSKESRSSLLLSAGESTFIKAHDSAAMSANSKPATPSGAKKDEKEEEERKKEHEYPGCCPCTPDLYSRVLGPTADETILSGIKTIYDICTRLNSSCSSNDEEDAQGRRGGPAAAARCQNKKCHCQQQGTIPENDNNSATSSTASATKNASIISHKKPEVLHSFSQTYQKISSESTQTVASVSASAVSSVNAHTQTDEKKPEAKKMSVSSESSQVKPPVSHQFSQTIQPVPSVTSEGSQVIPTTSSKTSQTTPLIDQNTTQGQQVNPDTTSNVSQTSALGSHQSLQTEGVKHESSGHQAAADLKHEGSQTLTHATDQKSPTGAGPAESPEAIARVLGGLRKLGINSDEALKMLEKSFGNDPKATLSEMIKAHQKPDEHKCICPPEPKICKCCKYSSSSLERQISRDGQSKCVCVSNSKKKLSKCRCDSKLKKSSASILSATGDSHPPEEVRYAVTKISKFREFTTYEVMKSTSNEPKSLPKSTEGVFVVKKKKKKTK